MAINKVVNKSTMTHAAMKNVIEYVLKDRKVKDGYVDITGPYLSETITKDGVYHAFLSEKKLQKKDSGRMYAHNIISFHRDEVISPEQALNIGRDFVNQFFGKYQNLITVHQDKDHLHLHIITNTVSFLDGEKLHQSKKDLQQQKDFTDELCRKHGLSVAEKGKHFDGTPIEDCEIISWSKNKYNLIKHNPHDSYIVKCGIAILEAKKNCNSKEEFLERMMERGQHTTQTETRKHITFENEKCEKVRDSNLNKTFNLDISKEVLLHEFERNNELRKERLRKRKIEQQYKEYEGGGGSDRQSSEAEQAAGNGEYQTEKHNNRFEIRDCDDDFAR